MSNFRFREKYIPIFLWLMPVSFFAFQFILRTMPGIMMNDIINKFEITALAFGALSAFYYLGYSGMQIPVGILLDKFKPRYIISACILACVFGNLTFIYSNNWSITVLGRFFVGVGSAVGFLGTAKVIRMWFSRENYSKMVGYTFSLGLIGAVYGGKPVTLLLEKYGFIKVLEVASMVGAFIAIMILLFLKEPKHYNKNNSDFSILSDLKQLFKNPYVLLVGVFGGMMVGPLEGFADIWGINYFSQVYHIKRADAALLTSFVFIGMCFGGPILAYFSNIVKSEIKVVGFAGIVMALIFIFLFISLIMEKEIIFLIMFILGILCCYQVLIFAIVNNLVEERLSGLATALTNSLNMSFGFVFHMAIGYLMDKNWDGKIVDGVKIYSNNTYIASLSIIPVCLFLGALGLSLMKKK